MTTAQRLIDRAPTERRLMEMANAIAADIRIEGPPDAEVAVYEFDDGSQLVLRD